MSEISVKVNQCDVHEFDKKEPLKSLATRTCDVCERDLCSHSSHDGDTYRSTQHMRNPFTSFVCSDCWGLLDFNGYKNGTTPLPKGSIDLHASGSTMAINVAEYREWVEETVHQWSQQAVLEVLRSIHSGRKVKFDLEAEKKAIEAKLEAEVEELRQRKYAEASQ